MSVARPSQVAQYHLGEPGALGNFGRRYGLICRQSAIQNRPENLTSKNIVIYGKIQIGITCIIHLTLEYKIVSKNNCFIDVWLQAFIKIKTVYMTSEMHRR